MSARPPVTPPGSTRPTPEQVNAMVAAQFPGIRNRCAALGADWALARREVVPADIRPGGYISGPAQFALADVAMWFLSFAVMSRIEPMALTSELSIRFLRPAQGRLLWARAALESAGRRQIVASVRIWVDNGEDAPCSVAQGTYVIPREGTGPLPV